MTLYRAVEGISPFRCSTPTETFNAILSYDPPPPARAGRLTELIMRLLDKNPDERLTIPQALTLINGPPSPLTGLGPIPTATGATVIDMGPPQAWEPVAEHSVTVASDKPETGDRIHSEDALTVTSTTGGVASREPIREPEGNPARAYGPSRSYKVRRLLKSLHDDKFRTPVGIIAVYVILPVAALADFRFVAEPVGSAAAHAVFDFFAPYQGNRFVNDSVSFVFGIIVGFAAFLAPGYILYILGRIINALRRPY